MAEAAVVHKGLEGVVASDSGVSFIDGTKGRLYYRGYSIEDLAANCTYEEVAYLLLHGKLPSKKELTAFSDKLKALRGLSKETVKTIKSYHKAMSPMEALRTTVSALADNEPDVRKVPIEEQLEKGIALVAKMPTIVAYHYRIKNGLKVVKPSRRLGHAANFLYMLTGEKPDDINARALDMDFVLHADHGFNASTFTLRVTASTLSDIYSALTAAVSALKGPLHGGAAREVMLMLEEIKEPSNVDKYVRETLARKGGRIMGYGHRVYKVYDPRAKVLKRMAEETSRRKGSMRLFEIGEELERTVPKMRGVYPNVDFYSSIVYRNLGLHFELNSPVFAIGRSAGWVAHLMEQYRDNRLIRPLEHYVGPLDLPFVPLKDRR